MFSYFERLIDPLKIPAAATPPDGLLRFYLHYSRQVWPALGALMVTGFCRKATPGSNTPWWAITLSV